MHYQSFCFPWLREINVSLKHVIPTPNIVTGALYHLFSSVGLSFENETSFASSQSCVLPSSGIKDSGSWYNLLLGWNYLIGHQIFKTCWIKTTFYQKLSKLWHELPFFNAFRLFLFYNGFFSWNIFNFWLSLEYCLRFLSNLSLAYNQLWN